MISRDFLLSKLTPFGNNKKLIVEYQDTDDIIKSLTDCHKKYRSEYDKISKYFWKGNVQDTCSYIWKFLKQNVYYDVEPDNFQSVKSPSAILSTGRFKNGKNDCKHLSSFFGGVLESLGRLYNIKINWVYRFANYKLFNTTPHHVFVVCKYRGAEIWCDAVLNRFNDKKPYINKIDKKMSLYSISGVGCECLCNKKVRSLGNDNFGEINPFMEASIGRRSRAERKARRKSRRDKRRYGENCKGRTGTKIAFALPRKAYLLLLRLNVKKMAVKMNAVLSNPATRVKAIEKWCKLGGNARLLKSTTEKAYNKYKRKRNISGADDFYMGDMEEMSGIGFAIPTLIASALPIIKAMLPLVKAVLPMLKKEGDVSEGDNGDDTQEEETDTSSSGDSIEGFDTKNLLIYGALGVGLFFLYKKAK